MKAAFVVVIIAAALCSAEADTGIELFAKINAIKQLADETYFPSMELTEVDKTTGEVHTLGDTDAVSQVEAHRNKDARAEGLLAKASALLDRVAPTQNLGESHETVAADDNEFPRIVHSNPSHVAATIRRVVEYFGNLAHDGHRLNQEKLDEARKWYIDTTATVLGRFAYDDTEFKMGSAQAHDVSGLKTRAVAAKKAMDRMDAARHMHKMGADSHMSHRGLNVLTQIERTGRLAAFLAEIEDSRALRDAQPTYAKPQNEEQAKADMKAKHKQLRKHISKLAALQEREGEITQAINQLMKNIAHGDPITGQSNKAINAAAKQKEAAVSNDAHKELQAQLNEAADKEDKARIVEAAGHLAENKIMKTMNKALSTKKKKKSDAKVIPMEKVRPMVEVKDDLQMPITTLHEHVTGYLNNKLGHVLNLFKKRHSQHKHLSTSEHKKVSKTLRDMAAQLMKKFSSKAHKKKAIKPVKLPKIHRKPKPVKKAHKKATAVPKPKKPTTWTHKGAVKKEKKAMAAGNAEAPSQGTAPVSSASTVDKFIWHTLGPHGAVRTSTPNSLAELLKHGVHLMNGGRLRFVMRP